MKSEPPIDRGRLIEAVRDAYGLPVVALEFIPVGFAAACYAVELAGGGARHFLKVWPDTRSNRATAQTRTTTLRLIQALDERTGVRVPAPLDALDGEVLTAFEGGPFALFPFVEGHAPTWDGTPWPDALVDRYAELLATLHASTDALAGDFEALLPREDFGTPWEPDLRAALASLEDIDSGARPGLRALKAMVLPQRDEVLAQLTRIAQLRAVVRDLDSPYVLVHMDSGGWNLIVEPDGGLTLLDWDDARWAPPEYDLHEIRRLGRDGMARFVASYREAGGAGPLHLEHFEFALLRRHVEDMTVRVLGILEEERPEEDLDSLAAISECIERWRALDTVLIDLRAALED